MKKPDRITHRKRGPEPDRNQELFGVEAVRVVERVSDAFLHVARTDPDSISAIELRALRRSEHPSLRSCVPIVLSQRRPELYLRIAPRFLADPAHQVRRTAIDSIGTAALMLGLDHRSPEVRPLLDWGLRDRSKKVKQATRQIEELLSTDL